MCSDTIKTVEDVSVEEIEAFEIILDMITAQEVVT